MSHFLLHEVFPRRGGLGAALLSLGLLLPLSPNAQAQPADAPSSSAPSSAAPDLPTAEAPQPTPVSLRIIPASPAQDADVRQALAVTLTQAPPPRTLAEVDDWSRRLTAALRQGGFPIGQVLMTQSDWDAATRGGPVVFAVFPGRIGEIVLRNQSRVNDERLRRTIIHALCPEAGEGDEVEAESSASTGTSTSTTHPHPHPHNAHSTPDPLAGCLFQSPRFERATQLLQDLPGVALAGAPQFGPGAGVGEAQVVFNVAERGKPYAFDAFIDNNGIPATGRARLGVSASANNTLGLGEDYALTLMRSSRNAWTGSLTGSLPLGWNGLRANAAYTRSQYTLTAGGTAFVGLSNTYSVGMNYPFTRGLDRNVWGGLSLLHTDAQMDYGDFGFTTRSSLNAARASVSANSGDRAQQLGTSLWSASGALSVGRQDNDDPLDTGPRRAGAYAKLAASGFGRWMANEVGSRFLTASLVAQSSLNRNLDISEQLALGGPTAARAYRTDEALVNDGLIVRLDARQRWQLAPGHSVQAGPFIDLAYGRVNHSPWPDWSAGYVGIPNVSNTRRLAGYGLGVEYLTPLGATVSLSAARPFGFADASWVEPGKKPVQYWLSLSWNYQ